jgi:hypothetical protein
MSTEGDCHGVDESEDRQGQALSLAVPSRVKFLRVLQSPSLAGQLHLHCPYTSDADVTGLLCGGTSTCAAGPGMCVNGGK